MSTICDSPNAGASLDRDSYEPAYAQVVRILSDEIARGMRRPGDQLPSESQLCARFGVSGMTVRRAMNILVDRGVVSAAQGKGVFVRGLDMREADFKFRERYARPATLGEDEVRLLEASIARADSRVARKLAVPPESRVVYLRRLVRGDGQPVMFHREYLVYNPRRPIVEAELRITSLEGLFRGHNGQGLRRGDLRLEAVALDREEADLLECPVGAPALCLEHIFYDFENRPVAWGWFICRADRYHLVSRIGADTA